MTLLETRHCSTWRSLFSDCDLFLPVRRVIVFPVEVVVVGVSIVGAHSDDRLVTKKSGFDSSFIAFRGVD